MKAFLVSVLAFLVSVVTASLVPRQTNVDQFIMTAANSAISQVNGRNAYVSLNSSKVYLGPALGETVELIIVQYNPGEQTIEDDFQKRLWIVNDESEKGAVYLEIDDPFSGSSDRPYQISSSGEVTFSGTEFPNGWTTCPTDLPETYQLFYQIFDPGCAAVKLIKGQVPVL